MIFGLIPAAGLSTRMHDYKMTLPCKSRTVIETTTASLLDAGVERVVIVLGHRADEVRKALLDFGDKVLFVYNEEYASSDMMHSIQCGCSEMPPCDAFFLLPGDMPMVSEKTIHALQMAYISEPKAKVIFPTIQGRRKHPPLISSELIPKILAFRGEGGLRALWETMEDGILAVPVTDMGIQVDLDTKEDYLRHCK